MIGATPPLHLPAWLGRPLAGEFVVAQMTTARGASNEKARKVLGWEPRYASWREGSVPGSADEAYRPLLFSIALSPVERAVFMLREVFGYGYPDVARIVGKSEVSCRQIFARARQRISAGAPVREDDAPPPRRAEGEELARRFFEAAAGGDMDALPDMLAPDVVLHGDGGGKTQTVREPPGPAGQ